jgi:hypothetical protein
MPAADWWKRLLQSEELTAGWLLANRVAGSSSMIHTHHRGRRTKKTQGFLILSSIRKLIKSPPVNGAPTFQGACHVIK